MAFKYKNKEIREKRNAAKYIFISVFALILFLISASVIPFIAQNGRIPSGDLLLCLIGAFCAYATLKEGMVFALIFGLLADLFLYPPTSFSPIVYVAAVIVTGLLLKRFARVSSIIVAVCTLPAILIRCSVETVNALTNSDGLSLWDILGAYTLPMVVINFACAIVICFIFRRFMRVLGIRQQ